ncbi:isochorismatase family protein [Acidovorax sp. SUPP3334]|uniref:cysteine hydrolase family protein n=1 Tax=Acidovorax sp. SUPP3334 TaxID=2920881 RepID=UPI0023DE531D|nr:isochorismatase family protein [Acidovorax sp. SUPP3334]GKT20542.1 isochorismatase family protein [Acidovorax sp. SUPP3334]
MKICLIVIDVQESFRHRPYFTEASLPPYLAAQNALIDGCVARGVPVVRVLHSDGPAEPGNPFAIESGHVRPLDGLAPFEAAATFTKERHSALVGTALGVWLTQHGIQRLIVSGIRTEQCCETTTRHACDLGWEVDYALDATLTWDMVQPDGRPLTADDIRARTATVLQDRFATVCTAAQALARVDAAAA